MSLYSTYSEGKVERKSMLLVKKNIFDNFSEPGSYQFIIGLFLRSQVC